MSSSIRGLVVLLLLINFLQAQESRPSYDPLLVAEGSKAEILELVVEDQGRARNFPIRVYLPQTKKPAPVVLFSHGLGGSREGSSYLGKHWAARGFVAVFLQHPGSDEAVWKDKKLRERMPSMRKAASAENLILRCGDVKATLDQLEIWQKAEEQPLKGRLDLERVAMTGHSFGAVTTQWTSGQSNGLQSSFVDDRIKAAVIFSPSAPRAGSASKAFADVKVPWLLMTGTKDVSPIGDITVEQRLEVFKALAKGPHYELVLDGAEHSVFTDSRRGKRQKRHHPAILAISTAFLEANLLNSEEALGWLNGRGPRSVLKEEDSWRSKRAESEIESSNK